MALDIVKYGDPVLRQCARPVVVVTKELQDLAFEMLATMRGAKGVGLAAQQVGRLESVCVIDVPADCDDDPEVRAFNSRVEMPLVMFNPVVIAAEGEQDGREGCLSFPNMGAPLKRADKVACQYMDETGSPRVVSARGFLARAIQHETDHLRGVLYVDLIEPGERRKLEKKLDKLRTANGGTV